MSEFIEAFKNSAYFHLLFDNRDVILVYLSGSQLINITDEHSDFDIVVITNDVLKGPIHDDKFLKWKGRKVHWYFRSLSEFVDKTKEAWAMYCVGLVEFLFFNEDYIIYQKPNSDDLIAKLKMAKNDISKIGCYGLYEIYKELINKIDRQKRIEKNSYTKMISHLILASHVLIGDNLNKEAYMRIKRMRWQGLPEAEEKLAVQRLSLLKNYIETHPFDIDKKSEEIKAILQLF